MMELRKKICIFGTGGFGREVLGCIADVLSGTEGGLEESACFMVDDEFHDGEKVMGVDVIPRSQFDPQLFDIVIAVGDPHLRRAIVDLLPPKTTFATIIHPSAILSTSVKVGEGSIITAGVILTCNIVIGRHAHLNLQTTIGHDCVIGDYFTSAPAVNISGTCRFGDCVYFGTNAAVREGVTICNDVTIGMGGIVLKDICMAGVYIGNPVRKLEVGHKLS